jgi:chromosomal replication initiator protein
MSGPHGCNDNKDVVETFKEALIQRVGAERYQMWFTHGVEFKHGPDRMMVHVHGQFALERIKKHWLRELRGAALIACGAADIELRLDQPAARQIELPLEQTNVRSEPAPGGRARTTRPARQRGAARSISSLVSVGSSAGKDGAAREATPQTRTMLAQQAGQEVERQLELPALAQDDVESVATDSSNATVRIAGGEAKTFENFVLGTSNQLAHTAMTMVCQDPRAASPLFICGPTGSGKSHVLAAIADQFRRRHRMRRVVLLSAEQFTNDFIGSVNNVGGIVAFRRRYREVDALLIDGMQFLGSKKATLREMLYTVETIIGSGRPLIASGIQSPTEIHGLSAELAGRLAAGLVCPLQPIDLATRGKLLRRAIEQCCPLPMPEATIEQVNAHLAGDGRVIRGVANLINTLQRMNGRIPTIDELRRFGGDLLRSSQPVATLSVIESAVCRAFQLPEDTLRSGAQTRSVTEPRMLAMYLARQLTSSAYSEIARHFGGRSHSTAIGAERKVKNWLESQKPIGRGLQAMSTQEAIDRIEQLLRTG